MYINQSLDFIELMLSKIMSKIETEKSSIHIIKKEKEKGSCYLSIYVRYCP